MKAQFIVYEIQTDGLDIIVDGIVNEGEILLGTLFDSVSRSFVRFDKSVLEDSNATSVVDLTVARINCYYKEFDSLSCGVSGRLFLKGTGAENIVPDCVLFSN